MTSRVACRSRARTARARSPLLGASLVLGLALAGCRAGVTHGDLLYAEGCDRLAAGDTTAALAQLEAAAYASPKDARIQARMAEVLACQQSFEAHWRAAAGFRRAIALDPRQAAYSAALGQLLQAQGFWHEGHGALRRAVELDPALGRAWLGLGTSYLRAWLDTPDSESLRDSALACNERALALDSLDTTARYRVAFLTFRDDRLRARAIAAGGPQSGPAASRFALLSATMAYRAGDDQAAAAWLDTALGQMAATARDSLLDPRRVLPPETLPPCDPCTPEQRDSLALANWWSLDPTPGTPRNERLLEHAARCVEADFCFGVPILHRAGRDSDRGDIYVRYGAPDWMLRDAEIAWPAWRWNYDDLGGESEEFLFVDEMLNGSYRRQRRGAGADYLHLEAQERVPQLSRRTFGSPAPGWEHATYRFRDRDGQPALEVAYAFASTVALDSVGLEIATWTSPGQAGPMRRLAVDPRRLHRRGDGHAVGRFRIAVPCIPFVAGLQAAAWGEQTNSDAHHPEWWAASRDSIQPAACDSTALGMSDLVPAAVLRRSDRSAYDLGGATVVPSLAAVVDPAGTLHLYFEIYPSATMLAGRQRLDMSYRVEELPPQTWHFRDQFSAALRARAARHTLVQATFRVRARQAIEPQPLSIDVRQLDPGDYLLSVEVVGPAGERVVRSLPFTVPKRDRLP